MNIALFAFSVKVIFRWNYRYEASNIAYSFIITIAGLIEPRNICSAIIGGCGIVKTLQKDAIQILINVLRSLLEKG